MVAWRRRGIDLEMSVNLSARNLIDAELPGRDRSSCSSTESQRSG